jgi:hypothetical protein
MSVVMNKTNKTISTLSNNTRLDGVLDRNRRSRLMDLAVAAIFPVAMLISGMTLASELPKLGVAERTPIVETVAAEQQPADLLAPV